MRQRQGSWCRLLGQRGLHVHYDVRLACAVGVARDRIHIRAHCHTITSTHCPDAQRVPNFRIIEVTKKMELVCKFAAALTLKF